MTGLPVMLEVAVVLLLATTVVYCVVLERRMRAFNEGRESLKLLVAELDSATARAERAVSGLAETTRDAQATLDKRISDARTLTRSLALIAAGPAQRASAARRAPARGPGEVAQ